MDTANGTGIDAIGYAFANVSDNGVSHNFLISGTRFSLFYLNRF
ncbi:hypothetical protein C1752_01415 [Acaryochloris thomasi RCC1774]|uniref:Uncharacterized protein n=1 Tax=Acaryochloris thomasi RCC1774 TaxID=1764569 RepID=A0A2W1JML1_9CYAN|nr:hypothetical protein C1752_01415 [Acaryochloris thomasi RCC1774]